MERPKIDGLDPDVQCYIDYLESIVNAYPKFQREVSKTLDVIADDLAVINSGSGGKLKILSGFKDDKIFERIVVILKMKNDFKGAVLAETEEKVPVKRKNIQDYVAKPK